MEKKYKPMGQNFIEDLMLKLFSTKKEGYNLTLIYQSLSTFSIEAGDIYTLGTTSYSSSMSPILRSLKEDEHLQDEREAKKIWKQPSKYNLQARKLYMMGKSTSMMRCL